jgi:methylenetetrahydrofolate--tRNA-(uracil-5-)-methyltransferase
VRLVEQKPDKRTPAQIGDGLAELVCSNSFRGAALTNAVGLLKEEMRRAGSLVMAVGRRGAPCPRAGRSPSIASASRAAMTARIDAHPRIREEIDTLREVPPSRGAPRRARDRPAHRRRARERPRERVVGAEHLAYYDAIAPIVSAESID